jgi:hypothetical protein
MAAKAGGGKATFKLMEQKLFTLGYEFQRINSRQWRIYAQSGYPEVSLSTAIHERDARMIAKRLDRLHGINQDVNKRNAQAIKDRRAAERARIRAEMDRLDAERAELIRLKEIAATADFDAMPQSDRLALEREIQRIEQEHRDWVRMMTQLEATA